MSSAQTNRIRIPVASRSWKYGTGPGLVVVVLQHTTQTSKGGGLLFCYCFITFRELWSFKKLILCLSLYSLRDFSHNYNKVRECVCVNCIDRTSKRWSSFKRFRLRKVVKVDEVVRGFSGGYKFWLCALALHLVLYYFILPQSVPKGQLLALNTFVNLGREAAVRGVVLIGTRANTRPHPPSSCLPLFHSPGDGLKCFRARRIASSRKRFTDSSRRARVKEIQKEIKVCVEKAEDKEKK